MKSRKRLPQIQLSDFQRNALNAEIKEFYLIERGEEIGLIEQIQLLDFFEERMAPIIYNKALDDAKKWFAQMMDNMDSDYYSLYKNELTDTLFQISPIHNTFPMSAGQSSSLPACFRSQSIPPVCAPNPPVPCRRYWPESPPTGEYSHP